MEQNTRTLTEELNDCYHAFVEAFAMTIAPYGDVEKVRIKEFVAQLAISYNPYAILTTSSISDIRDQVFTQELNRDFIWKLIFNYFSILGYDSKQYSNLCRSIAFACNVGDKYYTGELGATSVTPETIRDKLQAFESIEDFLRDNKWILMILLIILNYRREYTNSKSIMSLVEGG